MQPVKSSNIESVGYDDDTKTLKIKFKSGGTHHYADVDKLTYERLLSAQSIGSYFHTNIRNKFKSSPA